MSAPDRALQNLNLDEMPVTRSGASSSRGGRGKERNSKGSARMDPLLRPLPHSSESSRHGLRALQRPGSSGPPRANRVTRVTNQGTSIGFQVLPEPTRPGIASPTIQGSFAQTQPSSVSSTPVQVTVRIHYDTVRGAHRATCTCAEPNPLCFHVYWLVDRLNRELLYPSMIAASTMRIRIAELYPLMLDISEASLRRLINYSISSDSDDEDEYKGRARHAEAEGLSWPSARTTRRDQDHQYNLCDVLSSFDNSRTPEELHHEAFNRSRAITSQFNYVVKDDLHATLCRIAMREPHVISILQDLVSCEARATKYYEKQWSRVEGALKDTSITIPGCATILRNIVHQVYEDRPARLAQRDHGVRDKLGGMLADFLVRLVRRVVDEGQKGGYQNLTGRPAAPSNAPAKELNIYAYLIGDRPEPEPHMPERLTNLFVVGRFRDLDPSQWSGTRAQWADIMADIRSADVISVDEGEYADKIQEMLFIINGTDDPSEFATLHRMPRYHHRTSEQDSD